MKQRFFSLWAALLVFVSTQAQLLWKIEGNGLDKPSYVIGTYHVASASYVDSIHGLKNAINTCTQVYGEVDMKKMLTDPNSLKKIQEAMLLPNNQTIDQLLTPQQMHKINAFMNKTMGTDLNNKALTTMKRMSPAALNTQFTMLLTVQHDKGFNPQEGFDAYFQKVANEQKKKVGGLETIDFQIQTLYKSTPIKRQIEQLMCLIDHIDYQMNLIQRISKAFYAQDLNAIEQAMTEKRNNACDAKPEEEEALIYNRNANWAQKLPAIMKTGSTLIAVGAGHLPGERGLLKLLSAQGYKVTPVK